MNSIEIIEIRALHRTLEKLKTELYKILTGLNNELGEIKVKIYGRYNLETDFVILLMSESDRSNRGESQLGIRLSEGLKDFAMVNYSKWYELPVQSEYPERN